MPFSSRLVSSRLVSSRLVSAAALALALAACGDGTDTTTTTSTPPDNIPTLHSSLIGKTTAQQEALCEEDSTLLGCTGILAAKTARERQTEMDMLKLPFGGKLLFTRTIGGGSPTTGMLGSEAIQQVGLDAKPSKMIKNDGTEESDKYSAGAIFLVSSTGGGVGVETTNKLLYGVHAGNVERRPGGTQGTMAAELYNIFTKFMPTASGKYSIEVFHVKKDQGPQTRLDHGTVGGRYDGRNATLTTDINTGYDQRGTVTSLAKLSPTGKSAYMEIGSLKLNDHLGLQADDKMFEGWSYKILSGNSKLLPSDENAEGKFYAEVWDNYGVSKSDYMVGGVWLLMPEDGDKDMTKFAAFAQTNSSYARTSATNAGIKKAVEGTATYNGLAAGFYVNDTNQVHRLLGKVTMDADFGTDQIEGTLGGTITGITLNGEGDKGTLVLGHQAIQQNIQMISAPQTSRDTTVSGTINGVIMRGDWSGIFTGPQDPADDLKPTGVIGTASGYSPDEKHTFAVSFGAKPKAKK